MAEAPAPDNQPKSAQLTPLEDMTLTQLQEYAETLGFVGADVLSTKAQVLKVISNFQANQAAAQKALDDADKKHQEELAAAAAVNPEVAGMIQPEAAPQTLKKDEKGLVVDPTAPTAQDRAGERTEAKEWEGKAAKMKEYLWSQPLVNFLIPLSFGEKRGAYETVTMNGYRLNIMKGVMVEIPKDVANLLAESYQLTAEAGQDFLLDRNETVKEMLN